MGIADVYPADSEKRLGKDHSALDDFAVDDGNGHRCKWERGIGWETFHPKMVYGYCLRDIDLCGLSISQPDVEE